jgi:rhodanese-related sulfurtransferase
LFVCGVGQRSALACEMAASLGFTNIANIEGGTEGWKKRGYPIEM